MKTKELTYNIIHNIIFILKLRRYIKKRLQWFLWKIFIFFFFITLKLLKILNLMNYTKRTKFKIKFSYQCGVFKTIICHSFRENLLKF